MIKLFEQYNEYNQVQYWLDEMGIEDYTINDDLTVDVNGDVNISNMGLDEIPIQFGIVRGSFDIEDNYLRSLEGCPNHVDISFWCRSNKLTTLKGGPGYVGNHFNCNFNNALTSLEYSPEYVGGDFSCKHCSITTLNNASQGIDRYIWCDSNPLPHPVLRFNKAKILIKYQDEYGIWNNDGSFNQGRWNIFAKDYEAGILDN